MAKLRQIHRVAHLIFFPYAIVVKATHNFRIFLLPSRHQRSILQSARRSLPSNFFSEVPLLTDFRPCMGNLRLGPTYFVARKISGPRNKFLAGGYTRRSVGRCLEWIDESDTSVCWPSRDKWMRHGQES